MIWRIHITGAAVCAAITLVVTIAGFRPLAAKLGEAHAAVAELDDTRADATKTETTVRTLRRQLHDAQARFENARVDLEPAGAINARLALLSATAERLGLKIDELQPGATTSGDLFDTVHITIRGVGSFGACADFIHELRRDTPDMTVRAFDLAVSPRPTDGSTSFMFDVAWFTER